MTYFVRGPAHFELRMFYCIADSLLFRFILLCFCHLTLHSHLLHRALRSWRPLNVFRVGVAVLTVTIRLEDRTRLLLERKHGVSFERLAIRFRIDAFAKLIELSPFVVRLLTEWDTVHHRPEAVHVSVSHLVLLKLPLARALLPCPISPLCKVPIHCALVIY